VIGINGIGLFLGDPVASTPTLVRAITYVADMVASIMSAWRSTGRRRISKA